MTMENLSLPFKVLALGPFVPQGKEKGFQKPIRIDLNHPDQIMEKIQLSFSISLPSHLCQWDHLLLDFKSLKDFHPDSLIEHHTSLKNLLEARRSVESLKSKGLKEEDIYAHLKQWPGLPIEIKREERPRPSEEVSTSVDRLLKMVAMPGDESTSAPESQPFITQINLLLQQILRQIFSNPDFRGLESTYQGLQFLMRQARGSQEILFDIVPVSLDTLEETLDHLTVSLIDELPSLVLLDLPFDNSPRSTELLERVALFSETLLTPCLCWISPKFLHLNQWEEIGKLPFLPHYIDDPAFAKWRKLRTLPAVKWIALTCNRFLIRYPYGSENRLKWVRFDEAEFPWISPVWAIAGLILESLSKTGWPTRFTDWQNIRLNDLALHSIEGDRAIPTEVNFSEDRIDQFIRTGLFPLVSPLNRDYAFTPKEITVGGNLLSSQLFLSRITHFLFWCKDQFEKDLEPSLLEERLKRAFSWFWEKTGNLLPSTFEVSANRPKPDSPIQVRLLIEPSRRMLPSGEKVELELSW